MPITFRSNMARGRFLFPALLVFAGFSGHSIASSPETWLEVRSPNFVVVTNSDEKTGRRVAAEFEQIRVVLKSFLPRARVDPGRPVVVLAMSDEKSLQTLLAEVDSKDSLRRTGLFKAAPERYFLVLRLDAEDPYQVVYHEYVHVLNYLNVGNMPPWLDEGLAEFYSATGVSDREVELGRLEPAYVSLLQKEKKELLRLDEIFAATRRSAAYNEPRKARLFYAQSWAITHYLVLAAEDGGPSRLQAFLDLLAGGVEQTVAARRAFGDLEQLERKLASYFKEPTFEFLRTTRPSAMERESFATRELPPAESRALRANFLINRKRVAEARVLLDEALELDQKLSLAHESMGLLHLLLGEFDQAEHAFAEALKLDSRSVLAQYYLASRLARRAETADERAVVESGFKRAIELDPGFAPGYDGLAVFYAKRRENLEEALALARKALDLEPGVSAYALHVREILMALGRTDEAIETGQRVLAQSRTDLDRERAIPFLDKLEHDPEARADRREMEPKATEKAPVGRGSEPLRLAQGTVSAVMCAPPAEMKLTLRLKSSFLTLHTADRNRVQFSFTRTTPLALDPCTDLERVTARLIYTPVRDKPWAGEIVVVELEYSKGR